MRRYDALVIGAGPAGSTAARLLAAAGWSVALAEKAGFPRRKVCGEFISATSAGVLDVPGIREAYVARAGPPIRRVSLIAGATAVAAAMPPFAGAGGPWGRALGREHLDVLLRDAAVTAGAMLLQPGKLIGLRAEGDLYRAQIQGDGTTEDVSAWRVIAANGSWEKGPLAPPARPHRPTDMLAFKAHFRDGFLAPDLMPLLMFPGGYGGMVQTDAGRLSLSCCMRRDAVARCRRDDPTMSAGEAVLAHIRHHCAGVQEALRSAELIGPILAAGPIRPGIRVEGSGRIFRVGNAAGEAHPIIAEGISMAIQSSWLLCRHLIASGPDAMEAAVATRVQKRYAADWRRQFAPRIRAAQILATVAMRTRSNALIAAAVAKAPGLLTWGARLSGKTALLG